MVRTRQAYLDAQRRGKSLDSKWLEAEIHRVFGPAGAHADLFTGLMRKAAAAPDLLEAAKLADGLCGVALGCLRRWATQNEDAYEALGAIETLASELRAAIGKAEGKE